MQSNHAAPPSTGSGQALAEGVFVPPLTKGAREDLSLSVTKCTNVVWSDLAGEVEEEGGDVAAKLEKRGVHATSR